MFKYRVGFPFWKTLARLGVTLSISVDVFYDDEAEVFVAISSNLRGLVAEAPTLKELLHEIRTTAEDLLYIALSHDAKMHTKIQGFAIA